MQISNFCSGIYSITDTNTNQFYIGSSINLKQRFIAHKSSLNLNKHGNHKLQTAFNANKQNLVFDVIESVVSDKHVLVEREQWYIDFFKPELNICRKVELPRTGIKHSEETKLKMSISRRNQIRKPHSQETKDKIRNAHFGKVMSVESRKKLSVAHKGRVGGMLGHKHTEEHKRKMSLLHSGKNNTFYGKKHTDEVKAKISALRTGKSTWNDDTKKKMSVRFSGKNNPFYGKKHSQETIDKIKASKNKNK